MEKNIKYIYGIIIVTLLILLIMTARLIPYIVLGQETEAVQTKPTYHVLVITQDTDDPFWNQLKAGATQAGQENNIFVEYANISTSSSEDIVKAAELAISYKVDGIAFQPNEIAKTSDIINKLINERIPLTIFEADLFRNSEILSVGSNSYEIGTMQGEMAALACPEKAEIAIILNGAEAKEQTQTNSLKMQGMMEILKKYPQMKIIKIAFAGSDMFEVEKLTGEILSENPNISLIICSDARSTPEVAQVLIDRSLVGQVKVIGFGSMPKTLQLIKNGVIYGTIYPDSYSIGYAAVMQLLYQINEEKVFDATNIEIYNVTSENIDEHIL